MMQALPRAHFCHSRGVKTGPVSMYEYELFAVVNHEGQMDTGHYTDFARYQDEVR